jgi:hypothetical protein
MLEMLTSQGAEKWECKVLEEECDVVMRWNEESVLSDADAD